ncbi:uncharacterized protein KQ657_004034 [Scheffersomyces spartinae]|uniref:Uncharacterized protein n=1 Tax=Scheffersomyces spartinae TaxID=45513 RepID=A0A9P8AJM5_9ASCO|nr:uncharacterized protein KQ657_004034 [Scheffersomyces spartinae]KAG7194926.1 hypothetical protein KQ657_004034 [Scheffersomyces spartinae]
MILESPPDANDSLTGHIQSFPLIIEDQKTGKDIKKTRVYVNSSHTEDKGLIKGEDDILFPNISIVAICQEGLFMGLLTRNTYLTIRHRQVGVNELSDEQWKDSLLQLFPIEESDLMENGDNQIQIAARYVSLFENYDEELGYNDNSEAYCADHITLQFQTKATIPVTIGELELKRVYDEEEYEADLKGEEDHKDEEDPKDEDSYANYVNVFKWMDLLISHNKQLMEKCNVLIEERSNAENEKEKVFYNYNIAKQEFEEINKDLKNKFYTVLKAKKDRIWALQNALGQPTDTLFQLNEKYYEGGGLVSSKFDKLQKPQEVSQPPALKRQKVSFKSEPADPFQFKPMESSEPSEIAEPPIKKEQKLKQTSFYGRQKSDSELVHSVLGETDNDSDEDDGDAQEEQAEDSNTEYEDEENKSDSINEDEPDIIKSEDIIEDSLESVAQKDADDMVSESGTVYSEEDQGNKDDVDTTTRDDSMDQETDYGSE